MLPLLQDRASPYSPPFPAWTFKILISHYHVSQRTQTRWLRPGEGMLDWVTGYELNNPEQRLKKEEEKEKKPTLSVFLISRLKESLKEKKNINHIRIPPLDRMAFFRKWIDQRGHPLQNLPRDRTHVHKKEADGRLRYLFFQSLIDQLQETQCQA